MMDTHYTFSIMAFNRLGESPYSAGTASAKTTSSPPPGARHTMINRYLEEKSEIPFLIIASVSVGGVILLIINIILLHCFIQRRKAENTKDDVSMGRSSRASSKSATIEMYVGSNSYNETLSGETLGSLSDKSDTFYTEEHRHNLKDELNTGSVRATRMPGTAFLVDHNPIYSGSSLAPGCVYSTLPRPHPQQCYSFQEDLTRQRSVDNIETA